MDWTPVWIIGAQAAQLLFLKWWEPWVKAYGEESAKANARHDLQHLILDEVRAIKDIEQKAAGTLWDRQMLWTQKRDMYVGFLDVINVMLEAFGMIANLQTERERDPDGFSMQFREELVNRMKVANEATTTFSHLADLAQIIGTEALARAVIVFNKARYTKDKRNHNPIYWIDCIAAVISLRATVIEEAKRDLYGTAAVGS